MMKPVVEPMARLHRIMDHISGGGGSGSTGVGGASPPASSSAAAPSAGSSAGGAAATADTTSHLHPNEVREPVEHIDSPNLRYGSRLPHREDPGTPKKLPRVEISAVEPHEDIPTYVRRAMPRLSAADACRRILGAANWFKEGDVTIGVAAANPTSRSNARALLANTRLSWLCHEVDVLPDSVSEFVRETTDWDLFRRECSDWTVGDLRQVLLHADPAHIQRIMPALSSVAIASVVKLLNNDELTRVSRKIFNPLPNSQVGAQGFFGARIQPNSPTDHPEDIVWQVLNAFSFAVGDVLIGTNPVDGTPDSIARVEAALAEVVRTFGLQEQLPWCVLGHIDDQAAVAARHPGLVPVMFQSLAGTDTCLQTFGLTVDGLRRYARSGQAGFYFETGQGADFTNGGAHGVDMVLLEARKYGLARGLQAEAARALGRRPWLIVNDVAGFIGPEVFRTREQLLRACLEDLVMAKLHGLCMGHDICATLHMNVSPDDLDWCLDGVAAANPAFVMALPTKQDPMLSYLTTGFHDHLRLRARHGYRVNDAMWRFFQRLGVVDAATGQFTEHLGDPVWVYLQFRRAAGDQRPEAVVRAEGRAAAARVQARGVTLAWGHGAHPWEPRPELAAAVHDMYVDAKRCLFAELPESFAETLPRAVITRSCARDRWDYIVYPQHGETLSAESVRTLELLRSTWQQQQQASPSGQAEFPQAVLVVSEGLSAPSITDEGHLAPFVAELRQRMAAARVRLADEPVLLLQGRVRGGYAVGSVLFAQAPAAERRVVVHVVGERPGTPHHNFSVYVSAASGAVWARHGCDHHMARVVAGVSDTALQPAAAAAAVVQHVVELLKPRPE